MADVRTATRATCDGAEPAAKTLDHKLRPHATFGGSRDVHISLGRRGGKRSKRDIKAAASLLLLLLLLLLPVSSPNALSQASITLRPAFVARDDADAAAAADADAAAADDDDDAAGENWSCPKKPRREQTPNLKEG
jgi:hypothetical protein